MTRKGHSKHLSQHTFKILSATAANMSSEVTHNLLPKPKPCLKSRRTADNVLSVRAFSRLPSMNAVRTAVLRNGLAASRQNLAFARGVQGSLSKAQSSKAATPSLAQVKGNTLRAGVWVGLQQSTFHSPTVMLRAADNAQAISSRHNLRMHQRTSI